MGRESGSEKRRFPRLVASMRAQVVGPSGKVQATRLLDLSVGGALVGPHTHLPAGTHVTLALTSPSNGIKVEVLAVVRRDVQVDGENALGLAFEKKSDPVFLASLMSALSRTRST